MSTPSYVSPDDYRLSLMSHLALPSHHFGDDGDEHDVPRDDDVFPHDRFEFRRFPCLPRTFYLFSFRFSALRENDWLPFFVRQNNPPAVQPPPPRFHLVFSRVSTLFFFFLLHFLHLCRSYVLYPSRMHRTRVRTNSFGKLILVFCY